MKMNTDYYLYSGSIERSYDWEFINLVAREKKHDNCVVIMCSGGGNPDAAYKMARYLQHSYSGNYSVVVSGICKSAATLFAIGAEKLIFCPFGELGPLDIQMEKTDQVARQESGLNISEAFSSLEERAKTTFDNLLADQIQSTGGVVSFATAATVATGVLSALYGPIFQQIEPEEVGSRTRAMRIGEYYATRLNTNSNLKPEALQSLITTYPSHSFVIDYIEAKFLFNNVELASELDLKIIEKTGVECRFPASSRSPIIIRIDDNKIANLANEIENEPPERSHEEPGKEPGTNGSTNKKGTGNSRKTPRPEASKAKEHKDDSMPA